MRINSAVTGKQQNVADNANILSTTNPKGQITHINDEFVDISGFERDELIGQPHNIIRHPDMPRGAFELMWGRLKTGKPWLGAVKNRCHNGDHYWVRAYAIPITDASGKPIEYQSIRTRLEPEAQERAEALYAKLQEKEPKKGPIAAPKLKRKPSLTLRCGLTAAFGVAASSAAQWLAPSPALGTAATVAIMAGTVGGIYWVMKPLNRLVKTTREELDDTVAEHIFTGQRCDVGSLELALTAKSAELDAVVKRFKDLLKTLRETASETSELNSTSLSAANQQSLATEAIATAVAQMAGNAKQAAVDAAKMQDDIAAANERIASGQGLTHKTKGSAMALNRELNQVTGSVAQLSDASLQVNKALEGINDIDQQADRLALSASREAAKAGHADYGFALVAENMRQFAQDTREIVEVIDSTLSGLRKSVEGTKATIESCRSYAAATHEHAEQATHMFADAVDDASKVTRVSESVSAAANEQAAVSDEITLETSQAHSNGQAMTKTVKAANDSIRHLVSDIGEVKNLVKRLQETGL